MEQVLSIITESWTIHGKKHGSRPRLCTSVGALEFSYWSMMTSPFSAPHRPFPVKQVREYFLQQRELFEKHRNFFLTPLRLAEIAMVLRWTSCFCLMRVCAKSYLKTIVKSLVWLAHLSGPRCLLTWVLHFAQGINIEKENVESMPKTTKNTSPNGASYWSRLNFSDEDLILNFISSKFNLHLSYWSFFDLSSVV